jgi:hypothetical protein
MKKIIKILLVVIAVAIVGGLLYWQNNKRRIIKHSIADAIAKKTDSLYYIHYDSSHIDEINGNASFYNVVLQSDSAQKVSLNSTDSLPNALYNIRIQEVEVSGADIVGLMSNTTVSARKIVLLKPTILIINTGADHPKPFTKNDTLELYQKILGKFTSIKADTIQVSDGTLMITNKSGTPQTTVEKINITLKKFLVDDTKNYESILSYFVKDINVTVENIQLPASKNNNRINLEKVEYNAYKRSLQIKAIRQYQFKNMQPIIELKDIQISDLNTNSFIIQQRLKAGQVSCEGGLVTIYVKKNQAGSKAGEQSIELATDMIDQAHIGGINLGSTEVIIVNKDAPGKKPFALKNVRFKVNKNLKITEATTINSLINNSEWELSANGFSFTTKDKLYKLSVGDFVINNATSQVKIKKVSLKPLLTEQQFVKQSSHQNDQYNLVFNNIVLSGVNTKRLLSNQELEVEQASLQPIIKIFNDRTLPPDSGSKVGKYPQQSLLQLKYPLYIHSVQIKSGTVSYREKAVKSELTGNVFFSNINATLSNVTNIPERIKKSNLLKLHATAKFLGAGELETDWQFPLNAGNGAFAIKGKLKVMNAVTLNTIIEPLAMASVKEGTIDALTFAIDGTDTKATGDILFLYKNLKMELLKKGDEEELKKKGLLSLLANTLIKNENSNLTNKKTLIYERDTARSFFNLVWKTVFTGVKNTALGK